MLEWLFLPRAYLPLIRCLVGACLLLMGPWLCIRSLFFSPYAVPAWGRGLSYLWLPQTPLVLDAIVWIAVFASAIWLLIGKRGNGPVWVPVLAILFYGSREQWVIASHDVALLLSYLVALLFDRPGLNCSRRIIQCSLSIAYFFAAISKFHPEFLSGRTLHEMVNNGWTLRPFWASALQNLNVAEPALAVMAAAVIPLELFLAFGLWFGQTRRYAIVTSVVFHLTILVLVGGIDLFGPVMWIGILAFVDRRSGEEAVEPPAALSLRRKWEAAGALVVIGVLLLIPLRIYLFSARPLVALSGFDASPWSFTMYVFREEQADAAASFRLANGRWQDFPLTGRMRHLSGDIELLGLAKYILRKHPEATEVVITSDLLRNRHLLQTKRLSLLRSPSGVQPRLEFHQEELTPTGVSGRLRRS